MEIRDAVEDDLSAIADRAAGDVDPWHLLRERVLRVAIEPDTETVVRPDEGTIAGFLAFDVRADAVHVTRLGGDDDAIRALLDDAITVASRENLPLETVVPIGGSTAVALETKGFEAVESGPRFEGRETARFRLDSP